MADKPTEMVTLKVSVPRYITLPLKGGTEYTVDMASLDNEVAPAYLLIYGTKQQRDVFSGEKANPELPKGKQQADLGARCLDLIQQRFDGLAEGKAPRGGGGRRSVYGPVWDQADLILKAADIPVNRKAFKDALREAKDEREALRVLVKHLGYPIATRKLGRKAKAEDAQRGVTTLFERAKVAAERAEQDDLL